MGGSSGCRGLISPPSDGTRQERPSGAPVLVSGGCGRVGFDFNARTQRAAEAQGGFLVSWGLRRGLLGMIVGFYGGAVRQVRFKQMTEVLWRTGTQRRLMRLLVIAPTPYRAPGHGAKRLNYRDPAYLLTTDLTTPAEELIQSYLARWQIEVVSPRQLAAGGTAAPSLEARSADTALASRRPITRGLFALNDWLAEQASGHRPQATGHRPQALGPQAPGPQSLGPTIWVAAQRMRFAAPRYVSSCLSRKDEATLRPVRTTTGAR